MNPIYFAWKNLKEGIEKTNLSFFKTARLELYRLNIIVVDLDKQGNFTLVYGVDFQNKLVMFKVKE